MRGGASIPTSRLLGLGAEAQPRTYGFPAGRSSVPSGWPRTAFQIWSAVIPSPITTELASDLTQCDQACSPMSQPSPNVTTSIMRKLSVPFLARTTPPLVWSYITHARPALATDPSPTPTSKAALIDNPFSTLNAAKLVSPRKPVTVWPPSLAEKVAQDTGG